MHCPQRHMHALEKMIITHTGKCVYTWTLMNRSDKIKCAIISHQKYKSVSHSTQRTFQTDVSDIPRLKIRSWTISEWVEFLRPHKKCAVKIRFCCSIQAHSIELLVTMNISIECKLKANNFVYSLFYLVVASSQFNYWAILLRLVSVHICIARQYATVRKGPK